MTAIAQIPKGQSFRFATRGGTNNMDDLLSYEDDFTNAVKATGKDAFVYEVSKERVVTYQILTNYDTITTKLYLNGEEETITPNPITVTKKTSNIGASDTENVTLYEGDTGETKIYFDDLYGDLPVWGIVGQSVTIADGGSNNGTYTITEIGYDNTLDGFVLIFTHTFVSGGTGATCQTTYNIKDYEVYEVEVDFSGFPLPIDGSNVECYQIAHELTDTTYSDVTFLSEPIRHAQTDTDGYLVFTWEGDGTEFLIDYQYDQINEAHIKAKLFEVVPRGDINNYQDDEDKIYKLKGRYARALKLQIDYIPRGVSEQLAIALQHTTFKIGGVEFVSSEQPTYSIEENSVLNSFEVEIQQVELNGVNTL